MGVGLDALGHDGPHRGAGMRLASLGGRATLVMPGENAGGVDVPEMSGNKFGPGVHDLYDEWDAFRAFVADLDLTTVAAVPLDERELGAPVPTPRQVFGIGLNYRSHAAESGMDLPSVPATFTKFPASITGPFAEVELPNGTVDWEVELVVVIGRRCDRVAEADAWSHVAGLTVGQDLSDRTLQFAAGGQFSLGKSHRGFSPRALGRHPRRAGRSRRPGPRLQHRRETVQDARTSDLVFGVPQLIAELSAVVPLLPGDIIFTGTPAGVGLSRQPPRFLQPGETVTSWVEGIGTIRTGFIEPPARSEVTMLGDLQLAYLGVEVPHVAAVGDFLADIVGLVPGDDPGTWRNDDKAHRILLSEGPAADAIFVGFEAAGPDEWTATVDRLAGAGYPVGHASTEKTDARRVEALAHVDAPWGVRIEVTHGIADAQTPFASPLVAGGFVTEGQGFGHVVFATTDFETSHHFVTEGLGLRQTDWVETQIADGIELEIRFYHCNPRHHSLALARAPFELPSGCTTSWSRSPNAMTSATPSTGPGTPDAPSPAASVTTPTTRCSASTSSHQPASKSKSATAADSSPRTGTTTTATTESAPGATNPYPPASHRSRHAESSCCSSGQEPDDHPPDQPIHPSGR